MKSIALPALAALLSMPHPALAQDGVALSPEETVRLALEADPAVRAARSRLDAASAGVRSARAPFNPRAELAPGAGFTNGNALLSQEFDISGRRAAGGREAEGLRRAAEADLAAIRLNTASEARAAYFDLVRALAVRSAAAGAADLARSIGDLVRRRVEIGEAPRVQQSRAEIEVARAAQEVILADGEVRARRSRLNLLLGRPVDQELKPSAEPALPPPAAAGPALVQQAQQFRPELARIRALIEARRGGVDLAKAARRPELFAELAADVWSVDRSALQSRSLGIQARLSFPLFDRGRLRAQVEQAEAGVHEEEAELQAAARQIAIEIERAAAELEAARAVAGSYRSEILPRSQDLLQATQRGFQAGLTGFLEVLEAQRVVRQTQIEYQNALFNAVRAQIALDRTTGAVPGLDPQVRSESRPR